MYTTESPRIVALDAAYDFAVRILIDEFQQTDGNEIAGVAAAYALECWADWLPGTEGAVDPAVLRDKIFQVCERDGETN